MEKIIKLIELRKLNSKVSKGEISALQMVDEINEKAFKVYVKKLEKLFEELKHYQAINENKKAFIEQLETKIEDLTAENQSYERELNEKLINENHAFHFYRMGKFSGEVSFDRHYKEYLNELKNEINKA